MKGRVGPNGERGMTLIEVLVTILVISVGTMVTLGTFVHFSSAARKAQRRAVLNSVAQREIEQLRPISFAKLALTGAPPAEAATEAPRTGPGASEPVATGGVVRPGGDPFTYQGAKGKIYRYVTWRTSTCTGLTAKVQTQLAGQLGRTTAEVSAALPEVCPLASQTKRITVVIAPADPVSTTRPVRLSTIVEDPTSVTPQVVDDAALAVKKVTTALAGAGASGEPVVTQTLNLFDTRCNLASPLAPADHAARDTSQAGFTCSSSGPAPTLMSLAGVGGTTADSVRDFSTDVTRAAPGGLVLLRDTVAGSCTSSASMVYTNAEASARMHSIHTWASILPAAPLETPTSGGRAAVTLWASTANAVEGPARLCVTVRRASNGQVLGSSDFTLPSWPGRTTQLVTAFDLASSTVAAGERLLLTLRVPADSGSDLRVLYDHAKYQSSLAITTQVGKELR